MIAVFLIGTAFAQTPQDDLRSKIGGVRYPPLAEAARIQGDVHLNLTSGAATVLSGHPLLAQTALSSAKAFESIQTAELDVTYHFLLVDSITVVATSVIVKKGDAFDRAILRLFGFKTEKVVVDYQCQQGALRANELKISGANAEVWIYGRTFCVQTSGD